MKNRPSDNLEQFEFSYQGRSEMFELYYSVVTPQQEKERRKNMFFYFWKLNQNLNKTEVNQFVMPYFRQPSSDTERLLFMLL